MTFSRNICIWLCMVASQITFAQKLWEMEQAPGGNPNMKTFTYKEHSVQFSAWGRRSGRPGSPVLSAHGRPFTFKGECASQIKLKNIYGSFYKPKPGYPSYFPDLSRFAETRKGKDLQIGDYLKPYIEGFRDQCDELEDILVELKVAIVGSKKYIEYRGYLNKDTNWQLTDGQPAPKADYMASLTFGPLLGSRDQLAIRYSGPCEEEMSFVIAPRDGQLPRKTGFSLNEYASFNGFERVAKPFIAQVQKECINVKQVNFLLAYVPDSYYCPKGEVCRITASKANNWELVREGFKFDDPDLMTNYGDVIKYLLAGDYASFERYTQYFKLFYTDYMELYSEFCSASIKSPVRLRQYTFEQRYDSNGFLISEEQIGPEAEMFIEKEYLNTFKLYLRQNKLTQFNKVMLGYFNASKSGNMNPLVRAILGQRMDRKHIKNFLQKSCGSQDARKLHENLITFSNKL